MDTQVVHQERKKYWPGVPENNFDLIPYYTALQSLVKRTGAKLVIIGDTITLPMRGSYCVASPSSPHAGDRCNFVWHDSWQDRIADSDAYGRLAQDESTFFFPTYQYFCDNSPEQHCNANIPGTDTLAFFDEHHMTTAAALYLMPFLCNMFEEAGLLGNATGV